MILKFDILKTDGDESCCYLRVLLLLLQLRYSLCVIMHPAIE